VPEATTIYIYVCFSLIYSTNLPTLGLAKAMKVQTNIASKVNQAKVCLLGDISDRTFYIVSSENLC